MGRFGCLTLEDAANKAYGNPEDVEEFMESFHGGFVAAAAGVPGGFVCPGLVTDVTQIEGLLGYLEDVANKRNEQAPE